MEETFNWRIANQKESELRTKEDIQGLLDVSLDFWNKFGAGHTIQARLPKICYYHGRLKQTDQLLAFLTENTVNLELFINQDLFEFSKVLHSIGLHYPNLSEKELTLVEMFYCDPKYFDLMDDILFDQHLLSRQLDRYDSSVREIRNDTFSEDLKLKVFNAFIHADC